MEIRAPSRITSIVTMTRPKVDCERVLALELPSGGPVLDPTIPHLGRLGGDLTKSVSPRWRSRRGQHRGAASGLTSVAASWLDAPVVGDLPKSSSARALVARA